ncbi:MAG: DUF6090 family protein [Bacteroidota bacterium]
MLRFIRKLRNNAVMESNGNAYFKYAIGEIILVVVGILIALQINNWNEYRKDRDFEHYILKEMVNNLRTDRSLIDGILVQRRLTQKALENMNRYIHNETIPIDTLERDLLELITFERYFPIKTAYEVSKSNQMQITNEELRSTLATFYETDIMILQSALKDLERAFLSDFKPFARDFLLSFSYKKKLDFKSYPDPQLTEAVRQILLTYTGNHSSTVHYIESFRERSIKVEEEVLEELKRFE